MRALDRLDALSEALGEGRRRMLFFSARERLFEIDVELGQDGARLGVAGVGAGQLVAESFVEIA